MNYATFNAGLSRKEVRKAFTVGSVRVYGGSWEAARAVPNFTYIFHLNSPENLSAGLLSAVSGDAPAELCLGNHSRLVKVAWPDWGTPLLGDRQEWWSALAARLKNAGEWPNATAWGFCCTGGIGRTGTALSILARLTGATSGDPIDFIRANYDPNAVESVEQVKYVGAMSDWKYPRPQDKVSALELWHHGNGKEPWRQQKPKKK